MTQKTPKTESELNVFLYHVSHDLRGPLRHIREFMNIFIEDLPADIKLSDMQQKALEIIQHSTNLADEMLSALLELSRLNTEGADHQPLNVQVPFAAAKAELKSRIEATGATFVLPDVWPDITGDRAQLQKLFTKIIDNSLKFKRPDAPPIITVTATQTDQTWQIDIKDNGIGIPANQAEQALEIFGQLYVQEAYGGVGAGLTIAQKIMARHNGDLIIIPQNEGCCIRLAF